jgi:hypothetical protein
MVGDECRRFLQAVSASGGPLQMNAAVGTSGYSEKTRRQLLKACALQVRRVKRIALVKIAGLVAAAKPAGALFGGAVRK